MLGALAHKYRMPVSGSSCRPAIDPSGTHDAVTSPPRSGRSNIQRRHHLGCLACKSLAGSPSGRRIAPLSTSSATAPEQAKLYCLVQQHAATNFQRPEAEAGGDLARFVKDAFDTLLKYGIHDPWFPAHAL